MKSVARGPVRSLEDTRPTARASSVNSDTSTIAVANPTTRASADRRAIAGRRRTSAIDRPASGPNSGPIDHRADDGDLRVGDDADRREQGREHHERDERPGQGGVLTDPLGQLVPDDRVGALTRRVLLGLVHQCAEGGVDRVERHQAADRPPRARAGRAARRRRTRAPRRRSRRRRGSSPARLPPRRPRCGRTAAAAHRPRARRGRRPAGAPSTSAGRRCGGGGRLPAHGRQRCRLDAWTHR